MIFKITTKRNEMKRKDKIRKEIVAEAVQYLTLSEARLKAYFY